MFSGYENICRTCLKETTELTTVYKTINLSDDTLNLKDLLEQCTSLKVRYFKFLCSLNNKLY